jgi:hypothetical protein
MAPDPLAALLDAVHAALRAGDFAALPALTTRVAAIDAQGLPQAPDALRALARALRRNDACLQASARGLRAARRRLGEIAAARQGLQTYSRDGQRQQVGGGPGALAQRF